MCNHFSLNHLTVEFECLFTNHFSIQKAPQNNNNESENEQSLNDTTGVKQ